MYFLQIEVTRIGSLQRTVIKMSGKLIHAMSNWKYKTLNMKYLWNENEFHNIVMEKSGIIEWPQSNRMKYNM